MGEFDFGLFFQQVNRLIGKGERYDQCRNLVRQPSHIDYFFARRNPDSSKKFILRYGKTFRNARLPGSIKTIAPILMIQTMRGLAEYTVISPLPKLPWLSAVAGCAVPKDNPCFLNFFAKLNMTRKIGTFGKFGVTPQTISFSQPIRIPLATSGHMTRS